MAEAATVTNITCALTPHETLEPALCPLFWQHGEPADVLRDELRQMHAVGIRQCILESRPHPDYLGPGGWESLDTILNEAERLGMKIWIFDDAVFPSGFAGGRIRDHHPRWSNPTAKTRPRRLRPPERPAASARRIPSTAACRRNPWGCWGRCAFFAVNRED